MTTGLRRNSNTTSDEGEHDMASSDINTITIGGRLGADAELRETQGGTVCSFRVASTDAYKDRETTSWVRCVIFGKRGPALASYLTKGRKVIVSGKLRVREYEDRSGSRRTSVEVLVDQLDLGAPPREGGSPRAAPASGSQESPGFDDDLPF
ncbi:MAG: single-stranded DNA-binding protein [Bacteroidetes bacterium]|jgi:single-strand DNA-binding protein|nr:single-stranded DNA-binding protein [Bacteroidota bacterium]